MIKVKLLLKETKKMKKIVLTVAAAGLFSAASAMASSVDSGSCEMQTRYGDPMQTRYGGAMQTRYGTCLSSASKVKVVARLTGDVLFDSGSATLKEGARALLDSQAAAIVASGQKFVVEGHTDAQGSDSFNASLAKRRANSVVSYLVTRGVTSSNLSTRSVGEARPIADNGTSEGRAMNRRFEFIAIN